MRCDYSERACVSHHCVRDAGLDKVHRHCGKRSADVTDKRPDATCVRSLAAEAPVRDWADRTQAGSATAPGDTEPTEDAESCYCSGAGSSETSKSGAAFPAKCSTTTSTSRSVGC